MEQMARVREKVNRSNCMKYNLFLHHFIALDFVDGFISMLGKVHFPLPARMVCSSTSFNCIETGEMVFVTCEWESTLGRHPLGRHPRLTKTVGATLSFVT